MFMFLLIHLREAFFNKQPIFKNKTPVVASIARYKKGSNTSAKTQGRFLLQLIYLNTFVYIDLKAWRKTLIVLT